MVSTSPGRWSAARSTLVTMLHAKLRLVPMPAAQRWWCWATRTSRGRPTPRCHRCRTGPIAAGGPRRPADHHQRNGGLNSEALRVLPEGGGWLMVHLRRRHQGRGGRKARALIDDLRGTEHEPTVRFIDDPEHEEELADGARWPARRYRAGAGHARHLGGLGGLGGAAGPAGGLPAGPEQALRRVRLLTAPPCTGTSARAACTPGSPSTWSPPRASPPSAGSSSGPRTWSSPTAARAPASTATARPAASCCPDVRAGARPGLRAVQGGVRPGRPDEPGQGGRAVPARREPAARRLPGRRGTADTYFGFPDDDGRFEPRSMRCVGVGKCRRRRACGGG